MSLEISSLKIERFRGLQDINDINFNIINTIVSPGNFGKTSLLQALVTAMNYDYGQQIFYTAHLFKKTKCRDYDMLSQLLYESNGLSFYALSAVFGDVEIKKELKGNFSKNKKSFSGIYNASITSKNQNMTNSVENEINFSREKQEVCYNSGLCFPPVIYYDFETGCECEINEFRNNYLRKCIESFLRRFDSDITKVYMKNRKYMVSHGKHGEIVADTLGSAVKRFIEFVNFCDKNQGKIMIIENTDCLCVEACYSFLAEFLIPVILETGCQTFLTARSRSFGKNILESAKKSDAESFVNYIDIYKDEDKIKIRFE